MLLEGFSGRDGMCIQLVSAFFAEFCFLFSKLVSMVSGILDEALFVVVIAGMFVSVRVAVLFLDKIKYLTI
jgi:hypothetical protein